MLFETLLRPVEGDISTGIEGFCKVLGEQIFNYRGLVTVTNITGQEFGTMTDL